jgi:hypothetical protein
VVTNFVDIFNFVTTAFAGVHVRVSVIFWPSASIQARKSLMVSPGSIFEGSGFVKLEIDAPFPGALRWKRGSPGHFLHPAAAAVTLARS